jgi:hypothetical protein
MLDASVAREMLQRLDALIAWQQRISGQLVLMGGNPEEPEQALAGPAISTDIMEVLLAYVLPSSPAVTVPYTINNVTPTRLIVNESTNFVRVEITNDDPAQMCWLGDQNVSPAIGRVLLAQTTIPYVVPQGASVWAICIVATISVRVAMGYNLWELAKQSIGYYL